MFELTTLDEAAGNGGRHCKQVQDVVAEIGHQHRRVLGHVNDVTHRVRRPADDVQGLAMPNDLVRRPVRQRNRFRVAELFHQRQVQLELPLEFLRPDLLFRRRQQHVGQQAYRRNGGRGIDVAHDVDTEFVDHPAQPRRPLAVFGHRVAPVRLEAVEYRIEFDWLGNVHVDLAEIFA